MPRAIWTGAISFGLVNVPVKLYSATSPKTVRFHQLSGEDRRANPPEARRSLRPGTRSPSRTSSRATRSRRSATCWSRPTSSTRSTPRRPRRSTSRISSTSSEIDPIYFDHSYYLAPTAGGAKPYRLLLEAMREAGKVAIGRFVLRTKQQLARAAPDRRRADALDDALRRRGARRPTGSTSSTPCAEVEASEREVTMARQLIDSLSSRLRARASTATSTASACST